jgi:hypothetical protein
MSDEDEALTELHHDQYDSTSAGGVERAIGEVETAMGDANDSIYGELTPTSVNRMVLMIAGSLQAEQESQEGDTTIATPVSLLDVDGDALDASDFNGVGVVYMFDEGFVPTLMEHIGNCWNNSKEFQTWGERLDKMTNNEDEVYLYDDLPELLRRDGASDSDSSASDK